MSFWLLGANCQHVCSTCLNMDCNRNGVCNSGCIDGYYYISTTGACERCYTGCTRCGGYHHCYECASGYFLRQTDSYSYCSACPDRCSNCTDDYNCLSCKESGYWGATCQYSCTGCVNTCNKDNGCLSGCDIGFYRSHNTARNGYECKECPESCSSCINSTSCQHCKTQYWGTYCQNSCNVCKYSICDKSRGCTNGCITGYFLDQTSC